jgi:hypothetical protein
MTKNTRTLTEQEINELNAEIERLQKAKRAALAIADERSKENVDLRAALQALVDQINDYERVNNLAPNPGRTECWDSVARAKALLISVGTPAS